MTKTHFLLVKSIRTTFKYQPYTYLVIQYLPYTYLSWKLTPNNLCFDDEYNNLEE